MMGCATRRSGSVMNDKKQKWLKDVRSRKLSILTSRLNNFSTQGDKIKLLYEFELL